MKVNYDLVVPGVIVFVGVLIAAVFGSDAPQASAPMAKGTVTVRLAYFPNLTHAPALVGVAEGMWQRELGSDRLETKVVNAGSEAMEALLAGVLDFSYVGPSPAINTYIKTNGKALKIIAGACDGGASLVARSDLAIGSIRDLDGKRLAVPQLGGTQDVSARHFLAQAGLKTREMGGSVEIIPVKNGDMLALFRTKQIDAAWVPEPWAARFESEVGAKLVVDERDLWDGASFPTTVLVVRSAFAAKYPRLVEAALRAHNRAVALLQVDPRRGKEISNEQIERLTGKKIPPAILDAAWGRLQFVKAVSLKALNAQAESAVEAGYLKVDHMPLDEIIATGRGVNP